MCNIPILVIPIAMVLNVVSFIVCKMLKMKPYKSHLIICIIQNIIQSFSFIFVGEGELSPGIFIVWNIVCALIPLFNWFIRDFDEKTEDQNNMHFKAHIFPFYFQIIRTKPQTMSDLSKKIKRDASNFPIPFVVMDVGPDEVFSYQPAYQYYEKRGMDESYKLPLEYLSYQEDGDVPVLDETEKGPVAYIFQREAALLNLQNDINDVKKSIKKGYIGVAALNYKTQYSVFESKGRTFAIAFADDSFISKLKAYLYKYIGIFCLFMGSPLFFEVFCHFTLKTIIFKSKKVYSGTTDLKNMRTKSVEKEMNEKKHKPKKD